MFKDMLLYLLIYFALTSLLVFLPLTYLFTKVHLSTSVPAY